MREAIVISFPGIPSENHQSDRNWREDPNDDDPHNRIVDVLFPKRIDELNGRIY